MYPWRRILIPTDFSTAAARAADVAVTLAAAVGGTIDLVHVFSLPGVTLPDGSTFPWAVRSGNLTYVGEVPLSYRSPTDRSLAFADLIFDVLAPDRAARHAALLSQHDVGQDADPARLRAVVSELYRVPPPAQPRR